MDEPSVRVPSLSPREEVVTHRGHELSRACWSIWAEVIKKACLAGVFLFLDLKISLVANIKCVDAVSVDTGGPRLF